MNLTNNIFKIVLAGVVCCVGSAAYAQDTMMYRGGFADGYASVHNQTFYPQTAALPAHTAYCGGIGDGFAQGFHQEFSTQQLTQQAVYAGGIGDGYAHQLLQQFYPSILSHAVMYHGGEGDGYSAVIDQKFYPGFLTQFAAYTSDTNSYGDGYASNAEIAFQPENLSHFVIYQGGEGDGYAGHMAISYQPLAVGLMSFSGEMIQQKYSLLTWTIANEKDAMYYELQRAPNGTRYNSIYHQDVKSPSLEAITHAYEDHSPMRGANYYRLLIHEKDGSISYSNTVLLFYDGAKESLVIFPNPATHSLNIQYQSASAIQIRVTDIRGTTQYSGELPAGSQTSSVSVEKLVPGTYLLHILYKDSQETQTIRFVKH